ncbi:MAG TPA: hypothetical protein VMW66_01365 [Elusimicrobiales bacterium]|nr:hypothetical protein [Elusimicrobiales bacterium]
MIKTSNFISSITEVFYNNIRLKKIGIFFVYQRSGAGFWALKLRYKITAYAGDLGAQNFKFVFWSGRKFL